MIIFGLLYTVITKDCDSAVLILNSGIEKAFSLFITLAPIMCFWSGIMEICEKSHLTDLISRILSPLTRVLFGKASQNKEAMCKVSMNMSANLLGMGNAATPLGLDAMRELDKENSHPSVASHAMCMFIVINTASIQLIPSSVIALRAKAGSSSPSDILFPTIITTICAFTVGVSLAKFFAKKDFSYE